MSDGRQGRRHVRSGGAGAGRRAPGRFARSPFVRVLFGLLMVGSMSPAGAGIFDSLLLPGKVVEGHAEYEQDCARCHRRFEKRGQRRLCLDCHKKIRADVDGEKGFHGRIPGIASRECNGCHGEHKGRRADIVHLDPATFDHRQTDFVLRGAHAQVVCHSCHRKGRPAREAPASCVACHERQDVHKGKLGRRCQRCHGEDRWSKVTNFDHDETDFPLRAAHRDKASCRACHPDGRFAKVDGRCLSCHSIDDRHRGRFGPKCQDCHNERRWKEIRFDHRRDTDYPLSGRHARIACTACHDGRLYEQKLGTACIDCHEREDRHKGSFGRKCADCHSERSWSRLRFSHDRDTDYPLFGRHREVHCIACHKGGDIRRELDTRCRSCHRADDVHDGRLGRDCARCHDTDGWRERVRFDHALTRFPLLGLHATAACEDCHLDRRYRGTGRTCRDCHDGDDVHEGRLGGGCGRCHTANGWRVWRFDHDRQSEFPLRGKHRRLACKDCHVRPVKGAVTAPKACFACHRGDDVHRGNFGRHCERCHGEDDFSRVEIAP